MNKKKVYLMTFFFILIKKTKVNQWRKLTQGFLHGANTFAKKIPNGLFMRLSGYLLKVWGDGSKNI